MRGSGAVEEAQVEEEAQDEQAAPMRKQSESPFAAIDLLTPPAKKMRIGMKEGVQEPLLYLLTRNATQVDDSGDGDGGDADYVNGCDYDYD